MLDRLFKLLPFPFLVAAALVVGVAVSPGAAFASADSDFDEGGDLAYLLDFGFRNSSRDIGDLDSIVVMAWNGNEEGVYSYDALGFVSGDSDTVYFCDGSGKGVSRSGVYFDEGDWWFYDRSFSSVKLSSGWGFCKPVGSVAYVFPDSSSVSSGSYLYKVDYSGDESVVYDSSGSRVFPVQPDSGSSSSSSSSGDDDSGSFSSSSSGGGSDDTGDGGGSGDPGDDSVPVPVSDGPVSVAISELQELDVVQLIGDVITMQWVSTILLCLVVGLLVFVCFKPVRRL